jgi:hypothetical protein
MMRRLVEDVTTTTMTTTMTYDDAAGAEMLQLYDYDYP